MIHNRGRQPETALGVYIEHMFGGSYPHKFLKTKKGYTPIKSIKTAFFRAKNGAKGKSGYTLMVERFNGILRKEV